MMHELEVTALAVIIVPRRIVTNLNYGDFMRENIYFSIVGTLAIIFYYAFIFLGKKWIKISTKSVVVHVNVGDAILINTRAKW